VLIEFAENTAVRYQFPKNSILEFFTPTEPVLGHKTPAQTAVLASFLVPLKGREASDRSKGFELTKEYWQPVTMRFDGEDRLLRTLSSVVAQPDVVRKFMEEKMAKPEVEADAAAGAGAGAKPGEVVVIATSGIGTPAAPPEEVKKKPKGPVSGGKAPECYLALRLPKVKDNGGEAGMTVA